MPTILSSGAVALAGIADPRDRTTTFEIVPRPAPPPAAAPARVAAPADPDRPRSLLIVLAALFMMAAVAAGGGGGWSDRSAESGGAARVAFAPSPAMVVGNEADAAVVRLPGGVWHRVMPGESLAGVAERYYGSAQAWRWLAEANGLTQPPAVGAVLFVPAAAWPR